MTVGHTETLPVPSAGRQAGPHWLIRSIGSWFSFFWLLLVVGVTGTLWVGGQPDPHGSGQTLDGVWRFHPGDNPAWAEAGTDDRSWDRVTLVSDPNIRDGDVGFPGYLDGWHARGHPGLAGYGWYRRQVVLPPHGEFVLVGPPVVNDGYEIFWNGQRIGGIGKLSGSPKVNGTRPTLMRLPASSGDRTALLAIRAYMQPGAQRSAQSGGLRTVPVLASRADGEALYRAQWRRSIAGYIVEVVEPAAMLALAILALFAAPARFARWLALALVVSGCLRLGNAVSAWTDLISSPTLAWQRAVILAPIAKLAWTMAWNQWTDGRDRRLISLAAWIAWLVLTASAVVENELLAGVGRALIALSLAAIAIRILRFGEHKILVLTAMALTAVTQFAPDLNAMGVPGIWFPFNIGVSRSQYAFALVLPLLAYVLTAANQDSRERAATGQK